jgi:effector-binding domain-containing protein
MPTDVTPRFDVAVEEVPDRTIASITTEATMAAVGTVVHDALATLAHAAGDADAFAGPPGLIVHEMGGGSMTLEVFVPVDREIEVPAGVSFRTLDGGRVATTVHDGPYDEVGGAYQALTAWIADHREVACGPPREYYLNDPQADPSVVPRTRIEFPIAC